MLSDHSVHLRYFRKMSSMPQLILQKYSDIDHSKRHGTGGTVSPAGQRSQYRQPSVAIGQSISPQEIPARHPDRLFRCAMTLARAWVSIYSAQWKLRNHSRSASSLADVLAGQRRRDNALSNLEFLLPKRSDFGAVSHTFDCLRKLHKKLENKRQFSR
jgi:hypothetical protein